MQFDSVFNIIKIMNKILIITFIFNIFFYVTSAQSEVIYYSTDSLKIACFEKTNTEIEDYAEGICFGYIRAKIETLFFEDRLCQNLLNREDDLDKYVDIVMSNLSFANDRDYPMDFIQDILSKQFC